jgi:tetratricopeptide (TPR) repeat protein
MSIRRIVRVVFLIVRVVFLTLGIAARVSAQANATDAIEKGFQALQNGETEKAASIFREALARHPNDPEVLLGAGVVAQLQGRDAQAIALLKQALQIEPRLAVAAAILAEVLYRQGDIDVAIKMYERALPDAPAAARQVMRDRLDAWRKEASLPQNHEAMKDDRFSISFDGPVQHELAARATSVLGAAFWRIGKMLGAYPSASINVVLYSERQFHDITGAPEWSGGGFDGQIRMPVRGASQNLAQFDRVLTHELTHAMLSSLAPGNLPVWLNEGLAMYFEGRDVGRAERHLALARLFVPLAALQGSFMRLTTAEAVIAYDESAFATHVLLDRIGPSGLTLLLQDLKAGQTLEQAVERFGFTFVAFESGLERRVGATPRPTIGR